MAMTPFEFVNDINYGKKDLLADDPDGVKERDYVPFIVNRSLSFQVDTVIHANEMNCNHFLDKKLQYHYLLNIIRKKKRFGRWIKAEKYETIDLEMEYYNYSLQKAQEVADLITDDDLAYIKRQLDRGGLKER